MEHPFAVLRTARRLVRCLASFHTCTFFLTQGASPRLADTARYPTGLDEHMASQSTSELVYGWVEGSNTRGTVDILYSSLSTIWLCTWTSLCLNCSDGGKGRWKALLYKFRWQLFAIFFPEVLVAMAAEQWMSARQSVNTFHRLGHASSWSQRHGFLADMGGILVEPLDSEPFAVDSHQLAYLVEKKLLPMPYIKLEDIEALNKSDGLARVLTMAQVAWFSLSCSGRAAKEIGLAPLELETITFILCTLHTFFFWYYKPLDPPRPIILPLNHTVDDLRRPSNSEKSLYYSAITPLDFVKVPPDPKSLTMPFWFGVKIAFGPFIRTRRTPLSKYAQTFPNSEVSNPEGGVGWPLTIYLVVFQIMYYALHIGLGRVVPFASRAEFLIWEISNIVQFGLIATFVVCLWAGSHAASWLASWLFHQEAHTVLEVASLLPYWAKLLIHAPFVLGYIAARVLVLGVAFSTLRALPPVIYLGVNWSDFIPHI